MEVDIQDTPQSNRSHQKEAERLKKRLLELDLQELERLRVEKPYVQPQTIWARRVYDQKNTTQVSLPSDINGKGSNLSDVDEEEDSMEEMEVGDEESAMVETADVEIRGNSQEVRVNQPIGVGMGERLEFFAQQMTARHKPTTTRQYSQHWSAWQVCCFVGTHI